MIGIDANAPLKSSILDVVIEWKFCLFPVRMRQLTTLLFPSNIQKFVYKIVLYRSL